MLIATGTVSFDKAGWIIVVLGIGCLISLAIMGVALDSRAKAFKELSENKAAASQRRNALLLFMQVFNELRSIGDSKHQEAIPDDRICDDLAWVFTIAWEHDDFDLRVYVNHSVDTQATICYSIGGHEMPDYQFGPGHESIGRVPEYVRQILGIPEPKSVKEPSES